MSAASNAELSSITQDILWGCASDESIPSSDEDAVAPGSPSENLFSTSEDSDGDGDSAAVRNVIAAVAAERDVNTDTDADPAQTLRTYAACATKISKRMSCSQVTWR